MDKKVIGGIVVVAVIAVVAGLLIWNGNKPAGKIKSMSMSSQQGTTPNAVMASSVAIQNFAFSPTTIKVKKGTTVTWTNNDSVGHTVTATSGGGFDSGTLDSGQSYSFTFTAAGTFSYKCNIHPDMMGTVIVQN